MARTRRTRKTPAPSSPSQDLPPLRQGANMKNRSLQSAVRSVSSPKLMLAHELDGGFEESRI